MHSNPFTSFVSLEFFRQWRKHAGAMLISLVILFLLSSVLFISSSLQHTLAQALEGEPDFVVTRVQGGRAVPVPTEWADDLVELHGATRVAPRVHGRYFFEPKGVSFLIVGVDLFDEQAHAALAKVLNQADTKAFLDGDKMLAGSGVRRYLSSHFYPKDYNFLTPTGAFKKVEIFGTLPPQGDLIANDMILMPIDLAREILGYDEDHATDITLNVPNEDERDNLESRIAGLHYDLRIITKSDMRKAYANLYNYKGGLFLSLFVIALATFVLILYQRYAQVYSTQRRHIGLLRALGWSIRDVLMLKLYETSLVVLVSYIAGVVLAYFYVFGLGAPLLRDIFLGGANLSNHTRLTPVLDFRVLGSILLLYAVPFVAAVLIPVWKIAVTDPKEAML
jgi:ABC-type lipoprotein release transport system permease subunit